MKQIDKEYICNHCYCNYCKYYNDPGLVVTNTGLGRCIKDEVPDKKYGTRPYMKSLIFASTSGSNVIVNSYDPACASFEFTIHPQFDYDAQTPEELNSNRAISSFLTMLRTFKRFEDLVGPGYGHMHFNIP